MQRENGIVIGVVTDLDDPDRLGRIRVRFPHLADQQSYWARIAAPMAGKDRGFVFKPEVDDELLVGFEMGDPRRAYVLGALWSTVDTPPADDGKTKDNNWRLIKSRSGAIFRFDDTNGSEKIELIDKDGKRKLVIDTGNQKIQIVCQSGDIEIQAPSGKASVSAQTVEIKSSGEMTLEAGGTMTIKGSTVNIN